jgi:DnaJ-class molecular chaperone
MSKSNVESATALLDTYPVEVERSLVLLLQEGKLAGFDFVTDLAEEAATFGSLSQRQVGSARVNIINTSPLIGALAELLSQGHQASMPAPMTTIVCPACDGTRYYNIETGSHCYRCDGTGKQTPDQQRKTWRYERMRMREQNGGTIRTFAPKPPTRVSRMLEPSKG